MQADNLESSLTSLCPIPFFLGVNVSSLEYPPLPILS